MIEFFTGGAVATPTTTLEGKTMEKLNPIDTDTWKYAEQSMKWFGWGSPIGLGAFFMAIGVFVVLLHMAGLWH